MTNLRSEMNPRAASFTWVEPERPLAAKPGGGPGAEISCRLQGDGAELSERSVEDASEVC